MKLDSAQTSVDLKKACRAPQGANASLHCRVFCDTHLVVIMASKMRCHNICCPNRVFPLTIHSSPIKIRVWWSWIKYTWGFVKIMMRLGLIQVILGCLGMNILEIAKRWPIPMPSFLDFHPYDLSIRGLFCPPNECGGLLRSSEVDYSIKLKESLRYLCHGPMLRHNPFNQQ